MAVLLYIETSIHGVDRDNATVREADISDLERVEAELRQHPHDPTKRVARVRIDWADGAKGYVLQARDVLTLRRITDP